MVTDPLTRLVMKVNTLKRDFKAMTSLYEMRITELQDYVYDLRKERDEEAESRDNDSSEESHSS